MFTHDLLPTSQDKEKTLSDQRRFSLIDPASAPELLRLQRQLVNTEDALRDALDQTQQVEKLLEALRSHPDKSQVGMGELGWAIDARSQDPLLRLGRRCHFVGKSGTADRGPA